MNKIIHRVTYTIIGLCISVIVVLKIDMAIMQAEMRGVQEGRRQLQQCVETSNRFERAARDAQALVTRANATTALAQSNSDRFERVANDLLSTLRRCTATMEGYIKETK